MGTAHVEFFGGPEDGREVMIPAADDGLPVSRFTFPAHLPDNSAEQPDEPELLIYDRDQLRPDGTWRYHFAGTRLAGVL